MARARRRTTRAPTAPPGVDPFLETIRVEVGPYPAGSSSKIEQLLAAAKSGEHQKDIIQTFLDQGKTPQWIRKTFAAEKVQLTKQAKEALEEATARWSTEKTAQRVAAAEGKRVQRSTRRWSERGAEWRGLSASEKEAERVASLIGGRRTSLGKRLAGGKRGITPLRVAGGWARQAAGKLPGVGEARWLKGKLGGKGLLEVGKLGGLLGLLSVLGGRQERNLEKRQLEELLAAQRQRGSPREAARGKLTQLDTMSRAMREVQAGGQTPGMPIVDSLRVMNPKLLQELVQTLTVSVPAWRKLAPGETLIQGNAPDARRMELEVYPALEERLREETGIDVRGGMDEMDMMRRALMGQGNY